MKKTGCIVVNIGTPRTTSDADVEKYLKEFLMDGEVINIPYPLRWVFVNRMIAPKRAPESANKYKKIWTKNGSPLLVETIKYTEKLQMLLPDVKCLVGMRYGEPGIESACQTLVNDGCEKIIIFAQYPQYARASTLSSEKKVAEIFTKLNFKGEVKFIEPFYNTDAYVDAWVEKIKPHLDQHDHFLFSYHSLPLRQLKGKIPGCEGTDTCCSRAEACALNCYRAQSIKTTNLIAEKLGLPKEKYSYSFQSRLGPVQWLLPYTDKVLTELPMQGKTKLCVVTPSFTTDCLETLEEIAIEGKQSFLTSGGKHFTYVSCLNDFDSWVRSSSHLVQAAL